MNCTWDNFLRILPIWMRDDVNQSGQSVLQELRLRLGQPPELVLKGQSIRLGRIVTSDDLKFCINTASGYSPWSATTSANGYITAPGGHRIGICGEAIIKNGLMTGIRTPTMLCIRIARDFCGIAETFSNINRSVLIIGRPGAGKTTFLRDLIRQCSSKQRGSVGVVDERYEVFPISNGKFCFPTGNKTDVVSGCNKKQGIDLLLRCMGPETIAVDEITSEEDCKTLLHASWCGVNLIATAHAGNRQDLYSRVIYRPLIDSGIFDTLLIIHKDQTWTEERMNI